MKKLGVIAFIVILIYLLSFVSSATVVEVAPQPQPEKKTGIWQSIKSVLVSPLFWGIVLLFLFVCVVLVGLFFLIRWLIKYIKSQNDIFYKLKTDRFKMAKMHRRYDNCSHWWRVEKNIPVRLLREINGKPELSRPIAYYRGDYITHEGQIFLAVHLAERKRYLILPDIDVIVIPNYTEVKIFSIDKESKKKIEHLIDKLPSPSDIIHFSETGIIMKAESISRVGQFFVPVLKTKDGEIVDLSVPMYAKIKKVSVDDILYSQSSDFVHLQKKAIDQNPAIRMAEKLQDPNKSTEVTTGEQT